MNATEVLEIVAGITHYWGVRAMTIRAVNADKACATTLARLDESITVARTNDNDVLLLNMPRSIDEIEEAFPRPRRLTLIDGLRRFVGAR